MLISELFFSLQGEGKLLGVPSAFVRCSGCNLRRVWCDTPYTSWKPEGEQMAVDQIIERVIAFDTRHVVVTGGEPLIMPDVAELCGGLKAAGMHVTVETAATVFKPLELDLASLSPKLSNSTPWDREGGKFAARHEQLRINVPVIQQFVDESPDFQLKFVVSAPGDLDEIRGLLDRLNGWEPADVQLMPEGIDANVIAGRMPWLADICKREGFRLTPRLHVAIWGHERGT